MKKWLIPAIVGLAILAVAGYFSLSREKSSAPIDVANSWSGDLVAGNARALYDVSFPVEKSHYALSDDDLEALSREFFLQKTKGAKWIEGSKKSMKVPGEFHGGSLGLSQGWIELSNGRRIAQYATAYPEKGRGHIRFADALLDAWEIEEMQRLGRALTQLEGLDCWISAIQRDRKLLEKYGIDGTFLEPEQGGTFNSWDAAIERIKMIRGQIAKQSGSSLPAETNSPG